MFFPKEQQMPEVQSPSSESFLTPLPDYAATWVAYSNEDLGISFLYPKGYCVVSRTRSEATAAGHGNFEPYYKYFIEIQDARDPYDTAPCIDIFRMGIYPILSIQIFDRELSNDPRDFRQPGIKEFAFPSITIDNVVASRLLSGEGTTNKGARFYHIEFQKDNLLFSLFTSVTCTAKDGSCEPPRGESFIAEIDRIAKTIRFVP
jgi:hypothetical protein